MIQRKQSVYLLLAALVLVSMFFFDGIWENRAAETLVWYVPSLLVTGAITALVSLGAIFMYGDRNRQQKVVIGAQVLALILMVLLYGGLFLSGVGAQIRTGDLSTTTLIGLALPVVTYVLLYLARRGIQSDIKLVRSMDRLR